MNYADAFLTLSSCTPFWGVLCDSLKSLAPGELNGAYGVVKVSSPRCGFPYKSRAPRAQSHPHEALAACAQTPLLSELRPVPAQRCSVFKHVDTRSRQAALPCHPHSLDEGKCAPLSVSLRLFGTCVPLWCTKGSGLVSVCHLGEEHGSGQGAGLAALPRGWGVMAGGRWTEPRRAFLLSRRTNRLRESQNKGELICWPRESEPWQAGRDIADPLQAGIGRAGCRGNNGIYSRSWGISSIMFWLAYLEFGNVSFCWANITKAQAWLAKRLLTDEGSGRLGSFCGYFCPLPRGGLSLQTLFSWIWTWGSRGILEGSDGGKMVLLCGCLGPGGDISWNGLLCYFLCWVIFYNPVNMSLM